VRRTATVLVLALLLALTGAAPGVARDPVEDATREVRGLQAQVARAATAMTTATRRLDDSRRALTRVRRERADAEQQAERAQVRADAARDRLSRVVAAAYRSPVPDSFVLVLAGPEAFRAVTTAQGDLARASSSTADLLRTAAEGRERAQSAAARAEALERDATAQAEAVAQALADLRAQAQDTASELRAAWTRLGSARQAASCAGAPTSAANGFLPTSSLCPLAGAPGHRLRADAAADFARLTAASLAQRGTGLCVTDAYRSYPEQVDVFARKPNLAAVPGTSRHGLGVALDLGCGVESFDTEAHRWMQANGPRFGWVHPAWAGPGGSMPEPWHWEHVG
jgi:LAS superfamily LD-carboxypeptidase LdcB